jgi:hypothetical protein
MRRYARAYIDYLLKRFDHILYNDPDWIEAKAQIPTESHLRNLFLGTDLCRNVERSNSGIKIFETILEQAQSKSGFNNPNNNMSQPPRKKNKSFSTKKTADRKAKALAQTELTVAKTLATVAKTTNKQQQRKMAPRRPSEKARAKRPSHNHAGPKSEDWTNVTEVVGTGISISGTTPTGKVLFSAPLRVDSYPGTALNQEMFMWEQWKLHSWTFHFTSTVSDFDAGQLLAFFEPDPNVSFNDSSDNVRLGYARTTSRPLKIRKDGSITFTPDPADKAIRYCLAKTSDLRLVSYGTFYVVYVGGSKFTVPTDVYTVTNKQHISWFKRDLDAVSTATGGPANARVASTTGTLQNLLQGASAIDTGLPVALDSALGTLSIAQGAVGSANNVLVDIMAELRNDSGVRMATKLFSDYGVAPLDAYDSVDLIEPGGVTEAVSQYLFPGGFDLKKLAVQAVAGAAVHVLKSQLRAALVPKWVNSLNHHELHQYGTVHAKVPQAFSGVSSYMLNDARTTELIASPDSMQTEIADHTLVNNGLNLTFHTDLHMDGVSPNLVLTINKFGIWFVPSAPGSLVALTFRVRNNRRKPNRLPGLTLEGASSNYEPQWEVRGTGDTSNGSWDEIYRAMIVTTNGLVKIWYDMGEFIFPNAFFGFDLQYVDASIPDPGSLPAFRSFFGPPPSAMLRSGTYEKPTGSYNPWDGFTSTLEVKQGMVTPYTNADDSGVRLMSDEAIGVSEGYFCISGAVDQAFTDPTPAPLFSVDPVTVDGALELHAEAAIYSPTLIFMSMFKVVGPITAQSVMFHMFENRPMPANAYTCKAMQIAYCGNESSPAYASAMAGLKKLKAKKAKAEDEFVNLGARRTPLQMRN